jgi:hypothetical protein
MTAFSAQVTADERVLVRREGRTIATVAGRQGRKLAAALHDARDEAVRQQLLAKATGDYRRGNER